MITLGKSPCCRQPWSWHQLCGMRVYRQVGRKKVYDVQCTGCGMPYKATASGKVAA